MTFLPVIWRELAVAARKRSTFWFRVGAGILALFLSASFLLISTLSGMGTAGFGGALFKTLTWIALLTALAAGVFFTADALSEEKREGTLGFLFLTDLRGFDVAGGKLLATSLRGSFALLAFFPILAVTFLMGGVTGAEFWKTTLALINSLFFSLSIGLLASALSWDSQKAIILTFLSILFFCAVGPLLDAALNVLLKGVPRQVFGLTSPVYTFMLAGAWGRGRFWSGLLVTHFAAWLLLILAGVVVRESWSRQEAQRVSGSRSAMRSRARMAKALNTDPVLWLCSGERWSAWAVLIVALGLAFAQFAFFTSGNRPVRMALVQQLSRLVSWLLYIWVAAQGARLFLETRRSGFLEVLLVSPIGIKEAALGQWRALKRTFGFPLVLLMLVQIASTWSQFAELVYNSSGIQATPIWVEIASGAIAFLSAASWLLTVIALAWFGIWMGLRSKNLSLAVLKTVAFVQILPWIGISVVSGLAVMMLSLTQVSRLSGSGAVPAFFPLLIPLVMSGVTVVLSIVKDLIFISWARRRLFNCARETAIWGLVSYAVMAQGKPAQVAPAST